VRDTTVPRIKICGVTSLADARLVVESGADALGLIYASSVRQVVGDVAGDIVRRHRDDLWCVGVFRRQEDHEIVRIVERDGLAMVQLHDPASEALLESLERHGVAVIRALRVGDELNEVERDQVVAVLVDGAQPGSGEPNDWDAVAALDFAVPFLVAGGLTPDTVETVIALTSPWGVDVASGVEIAHGVKDAKKVASFVQRARAGLAQKGPQ